MHGPVFCLYDVHTGVSAYSAMIAGYGFARNSIPRKWGGRDKLTHRGLMRHFMLTPTGG